MKLTALTFLKSKNLDPKLFSYLNPSETGVDIVKLLEDFRDENLIENEDVVLNMQPKSVKKAIITIK